MEKYKFFYLLLIALFNFKNDSFCQKSDANLKVELNIIGEGSPAHEAQSLKSRTFYALISVTNTGDTTLSFLIMNCSWPIQNLTVLNKGMSIVHDGCNLNTIEQIDLKSKEAIKFNVLLTCEKDFQDSLVKVGFKYFKAKRGVKQLYLSEVEDSLIISSPAYLNNRLFNYEIVRN